MLLNKFLRERSIKKCKAFFIEQSKSNQNPSISPNHWTFLRYWLYIQLYNTNQSVVDVRRLLCNMFDITYQVDNSNDVILSILPSNWVSKLNEGMIDFFNISTPQNGLPYAMYNDNIGLYKKSLVELDKIIDVMLKQFKQQHEYQRKQRFSNKLKELNDFITSHLNGITPVVTIIVSIIIAVVTSLVKKGN